MGGRGCAKSRTRGRLMNVAGSVLPNDSETKGKGGGHKTEGGETHFIETSLENRREEGYRRLRMGKRELGAKLSSLYTRQKPVTQPSRTFLVTHTPRGKAAHQPLSVHQ